MARKPLTVDVEVARLRPGFESKPFAPGATEYAKVTLTLVKIVATEEEPWALGGSDRAFRVYEGDVLLGEVGAAYGSLDVSRSSTSRLRVDGARRLLWHAQPVRKPGQRRPGAFDLTSRKHALEILARGY